MSDRSAILNRIHKELDARDFFKRNSCTCRIQDDKVIILKKNGCDLNIRLGGRANQRQPDVHLFDKKVHDKRIFDFDWSRGLTNMQIREIVDYCEELVPMWQGKMKSGSTRKVRIEQSMSDKEQEKELRRNEVQKCWDSFQGNDDECELKRILNTNPFTQEIVDGWRKLLKRGGDGRFVLPCDEKLLQKIIESEARANYEPLPSLLPQPFAGDPHGDIWLLLDNPGYTPIDKFDNISVADKDDVFEKVRDMMLSELSKIRNADERKRREQSYGLLHSSDLFVERSPQKDVECLRRRQTLMLNQLLLNIDKALPFFWLDGSFRTVNANVFGRRLVGGHLWWRTKLNKFLRKGNDVRRVFAMEYFPYHSRNFKHNSKHDLLGEWASESCYHKFWRAMVEYGRKHGKRIIVRGKWMVDGSVDDRILNPGRYFEFVNPMNCSLSLDNIKIGC